MSAQEKQALNQAGELAQDRECHGSGGLVCSRDGSGVRSEAHLQLWAGLSPRRREAGVFGDSIEQNWDHGGGEVDLNKE